MSTSTMIPARPLPAARLLQAGAIAAIGAAVANVLFYFIAKAILGHEVAIPAEMGGVLQLGAVIAASAVGGIGGTAFYAALQRFTGRALPIFQIVSAVVALVSLLSPITAPGVDGGSKFILSAMHIIAAAVVVGVLTRAARAR